RMRFALLSAVLALGCAPSADRSGEAAQDVEPGFARAESTSSSSRVPLAPAEPVRRDRGWHELTAEENERIGSIPPPILSPYGLEKRHSGGCFPALECTGTPSVTSPDPFVVRATRLKPGVSATLFYGDVAVRPEGDEGEWVGGNVHRLE